MDKQLKTEIAVHWIPLLALVIIIVIPITIFTVDIVVNISDPYVKNVLSLAGDPARGEAIFQTNCAGCRGWQGNGLVGPSLKEVSRRKSTYGLIHQVISGETPPMPKFQPGFQEMADLLSYLEAI